MNTTSKWLLAAAISVTSLSAQAVSYTVTNLGALAPRYSDQFYIDLNEKGQVASSIAGAGGVAQAALWSNGAWSALNPGAESYGMGLNDLGHVVGATLVNGREIATVWKNGSAHLLPGFAGENGSGAEDINNAGQIVGRSDVTSPSGQGGPRAVLWTDGKPTYLPRPSDQAGGYSYATDINEAGQIIGRSNHYGPLIGTRWDNGVASWIGNPEGNHGWGINNHGTAVGSSSPGNGWVPTIWSAAGTIQLDQQGSFQDINDAGLAVGSADFTDPTWEQRAIVYLDGQVLDLNTLITGAPTGLELLTQAVAVNNQGQIVVFGEVNGDAWGTHAFLLTPVPEPEHYAMLLLGLGVVGFAARRKAGKRTAA